MRRRVKASQDSRIRQAKARAPLVDEPKPKLLQSQAMGILAYNATEQNRLLVRLFRRHMTQGEAVHFFRRLEDSNYARYRVNRRFRQKIGEDAIIRVALWKGVETTGGFWVLAANPELFDVPKRISLKAGKDVHLADILAPRFRRVLHYVAAHPWASLGELTKHFERDTVIRLRTDCNARHLDPRIELEFPDPLLGTKTKPILYRANPKFASKYRVPIPTEKTERPLEELFGEDDIKLLRRLALYKIATLAELAEGRKNSNVYQQLRKINERCRELNLPEAVIELKSYGRIRRFRMNRKFAQRFGIEIMQEKCLNAYFGPKQCRIIHHMVKHPLCTISEIGRALKMDPKHVSIRLSVIRSTCKREKFAPPKWLGTISAVHYLPNEFLETFNLDKVEWDPERSLCGKKQRRIYRHYRRQPEAKLKTAARRLNTSTNSLRLQKRKINARLEQFGFDTI